MIKKILATLEKKFHHLAIPGLLTYVMLLQAGVYFYGMGGNGQLFSLMILDGARVIQLGEYWRMVTFLLVPPMTGPFWLVIYLFLYAWIGNSLEKHWGTFKFNIYYFTGALALIAYALVSQKIILVRALNNSLFIAFATIFPNIELLIYFILPVKIKYLAFLQVAFDIYLFMTAPFIRASLTIAYLNYLVFFGEDFIKSLFFLKRKKEFQSQLKIATIVSTEGNRCLVCGANPFDDIEIEIRYCTKCQPPGRYCMKHLSEHEHQVAKKE